MKEEWLGTIYCLLICLGICVISTMIWNFIDKVETLVKEYRDRKENINNKWK
jgi:hypothetical protein